MNVKSYFEIKKSDDLKVGELVRVTVPELSLFGIVLPKDDVYGKMFLPLQPGPKSRAFQPYSIRQQFIVSYGSEWVIETLDDDETFVGNQKYQNTPGVFAFGAEGIYLIAADPGDGMPFQFNITDFSFDNRRYSETAPVPRWQIWANEQHAATIDAAPLFSFDADEAGRG